MKKIKFFALMSAIALTSVVGFTACSSGDETVAADINPTYDGTSVLTDFAFNITKASGTTRMSQTNTQEGGNFRGMEHMYLLPFNEEPKDNISTYTSNGTGSQATPTQNKNFALGSLTDSEISTSSSNSNSRKIYSLSLPIGTNNFLFYGKATRTNETGFHVGRLSSSFYDKENKKISSTSTTPIDADEIENTDDINFNLVGIAASLGEDANKLKDYLNAIVAAEFTTGSTTTTWASTVSIVANQTIPNADAYSSLADLYTKFTTVTSDRCGSAEAVLRTVQDLYKSAKAINAASTVAEVKDIANAICDKIKNGTGSGSDLSVTVTDTDSDPDKWKFTFSGLSDTKFPSGTLKLPMGAAQLSFSENKFSYKGTVSENTVVSSGTLYTNICYPAELVYFDNSPLRATDSYKKKDDFASTPEDWDTQYQIPSSSDWAGTEVTPSTRAVAMQNNVNYGVALLQSTVKLATEKLTDNKKAILGGNAENQTEIPGTEMKVTGILIGGQPASVGWKMVNKTTTFNNVIYDNDVQYGDKLSTSSTPTANYTVVLDNLTNATKQNDVNFVLQLVNGSEDFYGRYGLIPAGHTFYLVGQIQLTQYPSTGVREIPDVKSGSSTVKRTSSSYRITDESINRVFIQDYKTVANITISSDALQKAYSSIPDLRSTEVLFGLSVDLKWEKGFIYDIEL